MRRRTFLTAPFTIGIGALLAHLAACGASPVSAPPPPTSGGEELIKTLEPTMVLTARTLVAYFSRAGENYYYGGRTTLEVGNTEIVADLIAGAVDVDVYRIEAADPYPESYDETVERNVQEQTDEARPAIAGNLPDVTDYDTVLLGSGIWNVQPPMIMRTFVESVDLSGKTIFPFVTYAVSGLGRTIDDYTGLCPQSTIGEGLAIRGEEAQDAKAEVETWLQAIGLLPT